MTALLNVLDCKWSQGIRLFSVLTATAVLHIEIKAFSCFLTGNTEKPCTINPQLALTIKF